MYQEKWKASNEMPEKGNHTLKFNNFHTQLPFPLVQI